MNVLIWVFIIEVFFLIILSIIDLKTFNKAEGGIPSFLTTTFMFIVLVLIGLKGLLFGALAGLFALFLVDLGYFKGIPDIKVLIATGSSFPALMVFCAWLVVMLLMGTAMQLGVLKFTGIRRNKGEIPYIPIIALSYVVVIGGWLLMGGV